MCPFFLCLGESCPENIQKFQVLSSILFARFDWLKTHCALPKYFQTRIGCIPSSSNGTFCIDYLPITTSESIFVPWNLTESNAILQISLVLIIFFFLKFIVFSLKYFENRKGEATLSVIHFNEITFFQTF